MNRHSICDAILSKIHSTQLFLQFCWVSFGGKHGVNYTRQHKIKKASLKLFFCDLCGLRFGLSVVKRERPIGHAASCRFGATIISQTYYKLAISTAPV